MAKNTTKPIKKVPSSDVVRAIFDKHSGPEWVRFAEVSSSTGYNSGRRADAICMAIWPSKGYVIHGYEVKVSRADFLKEMKDINKAEEVGKYCDYWWLATPVGLVDVNEVPERWGLIELCKNGMRIKKQAPQRDAPSELPRDFIASLLRKGRDEDDKYIQMEIDEKTKQIEERLKRNYQREAEVRGGQVAKNANWIKRFEDRLGGSFRTFDIPENFADRMKIAKSLDFGKLSMLKHACNDVMAEIKEFEGKIKDVDNGRE